MSADRTQPGLYVLMLSVHGLVRGEDLELGRDADTGGQVKYVVELARALAAHDAIDRVDLLTRQIFSGSVDASYSRELEQIAPKAFIVRIPCGPRRYLRKERLWPYLDGFADQALMHIRRVGRIPDIIHGHYADAGYAGAELAGLLGIPFIFTGHSLGRVKKARLLEKGATAESLEQKYRIGRRIEAEETAMDSAALVVASTRQEVEEQYAIYDHYEPERMEVIAPGVDLGRFSPPVPGADRPAIADQIDRFLSQPGKPLILAMARPDERKNLEGLLAAYAGCSALRHRANLAIVAGNRDDIEDMQRGPRTVLTRMLLAIDRHDLYGSVAIPKHHAADDVPELYRLAAARRGIFVNSALTEPFGLTLIEAAASGLPVVATEDGGPRNILGVCRNGLLVNPLDTQAIAAALLDALGDAARWDAWSRNGIEGAHAHFSWSRHARHYVQQVRKVAAGAHPGLSLPLRPRPGLPMIDRLLVTDVDEILSGDREACEALMAQLARAGNHVGLAISTGRGKDSALAALQELDIPAPHILLASVGTEVYYGSRLVPDRVWERQIDYRWEPEKVRETLREIPGLAPQETVHQCRFKISYYINVKEAPPLRKIVRRLRQAGLAVSIVSSHGMFLDVLPVRCTPGSAIRHLGFKWDIPPERMLVAGYSGNEEMMLRGNTLGVVISNTRGELERLRGLPRIYFAEGAHAWGIIEGIAHYDFFGDIRIPDQDPAPDRAPADAVPTMV